MFDWQREGEVRQWLTNTLLASVVASPADPGLTEAEIQELGTRRGYGRGEVSAGIQEHRSRTSWGERLQPRPVDATFQLIDFNEMYDDDPRDYEAFLFVADAFQAAARQQDRGRATVQEGVLLERAVQRGLDRDCAAVAVASYVAAEQAVRQEGFILWRGNHAHPREHLRRREGGVHPAVSVLGDVRDVVARRDNGRTRAVDPLKGFVERLDVLGHADKRIWWEHTVSELLTLDSQTHPTSRLVLAAALAEGALSVLVRHAQRVTNCAAFGGRIFKGGEPTRHWTFDQLVGSARHEDARIIDSKLSDACMRINEDRKRIHLASFFDAPSTPAHLDIRPHEADAAVDTVRRLLTAILEWLALQKS